MRRLSFRSALTAALATRMIPVLTRDARRMEDARRCRPGADDGSVAARLAVVRAVTAGALDRAVDVAATLELRGFANARRAAARGAASRGRATTWRSRRRRAGLLCSAIAGLADGRRDRRPVPDVRADAPAPAPWLSRRRSSRSRCCRSPSRRGIAAVSTLTFEQLRLPLSRARTEPALRDVSLHVDAGEFVVLAGLSASGKSTLIRAACGLVPHFHGGEAPGRVRRRRPRHARARARRPRGGLRHAAPGPRDAGRDGHACAPSSPSRSRTAASEPPRSRAASRRPRSRSGSPSCSTARRTSCPAASCSASRSPRRSPAAPALVLLDEPTSQLDPVAGDELVWLLRRLNEEWGTAVVLAEHRLERCLAHADRVVVVDDGRRRLRRARPARCSTWAAEHAPALLTPSARLLRARRAAAAAVGRQGGARDAARARPARGPARAEAPAQADRGARARRPARAPSRDGRRRPRARRSRARRLARARRRPRDPARRRPRARAGRARRADGPQRRRQVDAAAPPRGPPAADARERRGGGPRRAAAAEPRRLPAARARRRRGERGGARGRRPRRVADRHPRDLSGGERQRLALAIVLDGDEPPAAVLLDEPTRGMDRAAKGELAGRLRALAAERDRGARRDARRRVRGGASPSA